jgi:hypothetical protein
VKLLVAAPVAMALHTCDGEKDQRRTAIADKKDPWRSARENGGGEGGRTAAVVKEEERRRRHEWKLGFFLSKGEHEWKRELFKATPRWEDESV